MSDAPHQPSQDLKPDAQGAFAPSCGSATLCPECGAATFVDTHCCASDHPELTFEYDFCTKCDWSGNERPLSQNVKADARRVEQPKEQQ